MVHRRFRVTYALDATRVTASRAKTKRHANKQSGLPVFFSTEEGCRNYFAKVRWPRGFVCPHCNCNKKSDMANGRYLCRGCRRQISSTSGTLFADSHKPLHDWFRALWILAGPGPGTNALSLQQALQIGSYRTAWQWLHKLRRAMGPSLDRLTGTVVVDEAYLDSGKLASGGVGCALVMIAAEMDGQAIGKIRLRVLPDDGVESIVTALKSVVKSGADVHTDALLAYSRLSLRGYGHSVVGYTAVVGASTLPQVQPVVSELKDWLRNTHRGGMRDDYLPFYLDEFAFRFNHRKTRSHLRRFQQLLTQAVRCPEPRAA